MNNLIALLPTSRLYERLNSEKKGAQEIFYKQFFFSVLFRCDHIQIIDAYQRRLSEVNMVQCVLHSKCTSSLALSIVSHKYTHTQSILLYDSTVHPVRKAFFNYLLFRDLPQLQLSIHIMIIEECIRRRRRRRCSLSFN